MSTHAAMGLTADTVLRFLRHHRDTLRQMGVKRIGLFGSYVRNEQSESSDVDLLFSMDPFTWAGWMDVWNFIEDGLGTTVHLIPEKDLREEIRPKVLSEVHMSKMLNDYLALPYTIEITPDEGAWFVQVKELPGCMTEVDEWDQILPAIEEALRLWIELALERGRPIPEPAGVAG